MNNISQLGPLEQEVMRIAWTKKHVTAREIVDELQQQRSIAYTTVMTIMTRLVQKGYLIELEKQGKAIVFQSTSTQKMAMKKLVKKMFSSLVDQFGEEAVAAFVDEAHLHTKKSKGKIDNT